MVGQGEENKPYTEYLIELNLDQKSWSVHRKYKEFCQLDLKLRERFPRVKFPESGVQVFKSMNKLSLFFSKRRPTVVEERRKLLEKYLTSLAQIDKVRFSTEFQGFLDVLHSTAVKEATVKRRPVARLSVDL